MEFSVGILGFGFMGRTHTYGLLNLPFFYKAPFRVKDLSICVTNPGKRDEAAQTGYYKTVAADWQALIDDPEINVICVASPNRFHQEQVEAALQAGKHVYCDKPVVATLAEAEALQGFLEKGGFSARHQVALQYRFVAAILRAKQLIDEGFVGRVAHYRTVYLHSSNIDPKKVLHWKSDRSMGGGGVFFDMGVHVLDLMRHLVGDMESICATSTIFHEKRPRADTGEIVGVDTDDATVSLVRHKNGAMGTVEASKVATGSCDELRFEIHGEQGALRFNMMDPNWLEAYDLRDEGGPIGGMRGFRRIECVQQYPKPASGFPHPKFTIGWLRPHMHCIYSFLESVAEGRTPSPSLEDGIYLQRVLEAGYRSAGGAGWVEIDGVRA